MTVLKKLLLLLVPVIVMAAIVCAGQAESSETFGEGLTWTFGYDGCLTISCTEGSGEIPDYSSSNRPPWYSLRTDIDKVVIDAHVTRIGTSAFSNCGKLTSVTIPGTVTSIGSSAFSGCSRLTSIAIPTGVTNIGSSAFSGCSRLTSITIPDGVTSIGSSAFYNCPAKRYVSSHNSNAIKILASAWYSYNIEGDPIDYRKDFDAAGNMTDWSAAGCDPAVSGPIAIPDGVTSIGDSAFFCSRMTSIAIPNSVRRIGSSAFSNCGNLTTIAIPAGVTSIGDSAFYNCAGLTTIAIPAGVTSIGSFAFSGCTALASLTIPDGVTHIDSEAFSNCSAIRFVASHDSNAVKALGIAGYSYNIEGEPVNYRKDYDAAGSMTAWSLVGCDMIASGVIRIPDGVTGIGEAAFYGCAGLTSIGLPATVTRIGESAFSGCTGLTAITIPDSVTDIGSAAFYNCPAKRLVSSHDSNAVKVLGIEEYSYNIVGDPVCYRKDYNADGSVDAWFAVGCDAAVSGAITIPDGVTGIGSSAFSGCTGLTSITIPGTVTGIGSSAFSGCTGLTELAIPGSVTTIGDYAFSGCTGLRTIALPVDASMIGNALTNCTRITNLTISGQGAMRDYRSGTAPWYDLRNTVGSVRIEPGITGIGEYAFCDFNGLMNVMIPESVTSIGAHAFPQNTSIKVYCRRDSYAEQWAEEQEMTVVPTDGKSDDDIRTVWFNDAAVQADMTKPARLSVNVFPAEAAPGIVWASSDPEIATVDGNGILTMLKRGTVTITATCGGKTASIEVTVVCSSDKITVPEEMWMLMSEGIRIPLTSEPEGAYMSLQWSSSNTDVMTVDANGMVTPKALGDATITVMTDTGLSAQCRVHVCADVRSVAFDRSGIELKFGHSDRLNAAVTTDDDRSFTNKFVTFTSSDPGIVSVDANGMVTANSVGSAVITATASNGKSATCTVAVSALPAPASRVKVIGEDAFSGTGFEEIDLRANEGVTIKAGAFAGNRLLKKVYLPASATIENGAFTSCPNLTLYCRTSEQAAYAEANGLEYVMYR